MFARTKTKIKWQLKRNTSNIIWLRRKGVTLGAQAVKGDNMKDAKARFKKRWPKARILDCKKANEQTPWITKENAI